MPFRSAVIDRCAALSAAGGHPDLLGDAAELWCESVAGLLDALCDVVIAGDAAGSARLAASMRRALLHFGATAAAAAAEEVESALTCCELARAARLLPALEATLSEVDGALGMLLAERAV